MPAPNAIGTQGINRTGASSASSHCNAVRQRQTRWPPRSVERRRPGLGATLCASIWIVSPAKAPCASPTPASCNFGAEADELHFRIQWRRCRFSSVRTKTGRLAFRKRRAPVLFPNFLGVGVTQSNGTIKNRPTGLRVRIGAEITLSLELDGFRRVALG